MKPKLYAVLKNKDTYRPHTRLIALFDVFDVIRYSYYKHFWKYVTFLPPFLQYFIANKCRLFPWIHLKEMLFFHFAYWI